MTSDSEKSRARVPGPIARGAAVEPAVHSDVEEIRPIVEIENFSLFYGDHQAIFDNDFVIPRGRITAFIGASGSGKSTLVRSFGKLHDPSAEVRATGQIRFDGIPVYDPTTDVIGVRRRMGMVFDRPNPFPFSIYENVVYPLRVAGERNRETLDEACELALRRADLWEECRDRLGSSGLALSGGQRQRLCIARAIVHEPDLLILDEPTFELDPVATAKIEELLFKLRDIFSIVLVTHSLTQASRTSDFTGFFKLGRLIEIGPTPEIFTVPAERETESYISGRTR